MNIKSTELMGMIVRGARAAFYADHPAQSQDGKAFEKWLGQAREVTATKGRSEVVEQLEIWCDRACDGESRTHIADLPLEDQKAIIAARYAFAAVVELESMAR